MAVLRARIASGRHVGGTLIEFALILPAFLTLMFGVFETGRMILAYALMNHALEETTRATMLRSAPGMDIPAQHNTAVGDYFRNTMSGMGTRLCAQPMDVQVTQSLDLANANVRITTIRVTCTFHFLIGGFNIDLTRQSSAYRIEPQAFQKPHIQRILTG